MNYLYLLIDLGTLSVPFLFSFYKKAPFYKEWKSLFPAILIVAAIFIAWDIAFTAMGVWGFNPAYLIGISVFGLPIEEWLFFICVPYSCVFIYYSLQFFIKQAFASRFIAIFCRVMAVVLFIISMIHYTKWYTFTACLGAALSFGLLGWKKPKWLGHFLLAFGISIIPFILVNGVLTGSWITNEVVWYNNNENSGIRMLTIPIEDNAYSFTMLSLNVFLFEWFRKMHRSKLN